MLHAVTCCRSGILLQEDDILPARSWSGLTPPRICYLGRPAARQAGIAPPSPSPVLTAAAGAGAAAFAAPCLAALLPGCRTDTSARRRHGMGAQRAVLCECGPVGQTRWDTCVGDMCACVCFRCCQQRHVCCGPRRGAAGKAGSAGFDTAVGRDGGGASTSVPVGPVLHCLVAWVHLSTGPQWLVIIIHTVPSLGGITNVCIPDPQPQSDSVGVILG